MIEEQPDQAPMASPMNDVRKLKANSAASADELIEWLSKMKGKAPREVLGAVASSNLISGFVQGAFLLAALILLWTGASWGWETYVAEWKTTGEETVEKKAAAAKEATETKVPDNVANPDTAKMPDLDIEAKRKVADKLGIGETKEVPANFNPLDNTDDDLLKGLE